MEKNTLILGDYQSLIFEFRGLKVMIDTDLASLYGTETKILKQQVKRNIERFPEDFMFELNVGEKRQLVTNCDRLRNLKHSSINPMVFTEQGVAMLSSILRSTKAVAVNIEIMRAFAKYRVMLMENRDLHHEIKALDGKINQVFKFLIDKIESLHLESDVHPRKRIGYKDYES